MAAYVLDTNHLGAAIRLEPYFREHLYHRHRTGDRFGSCIPAMCELEAGITQTARPQQARQTLVLLRRFVRVWPIDETTVREFGRVYIETKAQGRVLSTVDLILAALARQMGLTLLTTDRDFEAVHGLRCENWVEANP
jgi:predicted nucleic acid-binding protein